MLRPFAFAGARMPNSKTLSPEDRAAIERLLAVLETLRELRPGMTVHMAAALMRVAISDGRTVQELTRAAGVSPSTMSRALLDLGPITRAREPGMGLVEHVQSPADYRAHEMRLTPKGAALLRQLAALLRRR